MRALGGLDPERRVAARAAAAGDEIFALHLFGQREERLGLVLGAVDQLVGDAVVGDDREAIFLEAAAELLGEGVGVAVGVVQRNGRDVVVGDRSHGVDFTAGIISARQRRAHQIGEAAGEQSAKAEPGDHRPLVGREAAGHRHLDRDRAEIGEAAQARR